MEKEISIFIKSVGAKEPPKGSENYAKFRSIFRRSNYFVFDRKIIIVKLSRSTKPFFGVGKGYLDLLNTLNNYLLILLVSESEGWVYDKDAVNRMIAGGYWNLREQDNQYKINHHTLKQYHWFNNTDHFLAKLQTMAA